MNNLIPSTSSKKEPDRSMPKLESVDNDSDEKMSPSKSPRACPSQEKLLKEIADYNSQIDALSRMTGDEQAARMKKLEALRSGSEKRLKKLRCASEYTRKWRQLKKEEKSVSARRQVMDDPPSPELGKWATHQSDDEEPAVQMSAEAKPHAAKTQRKRINSSNAPRSPEDTPRSRKVVPSQSTSYEPMSKRARSMTSSSNHAPMAVPSTSGTSKKAVKLELIASLIFGSGEDFARPRNVLSASSKLEAGNLLSHAQFLESDFPGPNNVLSALSILEDGNTLSRAANTRARVASSTACVNAITTTPVRPHTGKRPRSLHSSEGATSRRTGASKRAKIVQSEALRNAADLPLTPTANGARFAATALALLMNPPTPTFHGSLPLDEFKMTSLVIYREPPAQISTDPANEASSKHEAVALAQGSHELQPQEACSTSGNQSVDLPLSTSTGEHEGGCLVQMQEANEASSNHESVAVAQGSRKLHPKEACSTSSTSTSGNQSVDLPSSTSTGRPLDTFNTTSFVIYREPPAQISPNPLNEASSNSEAVALAQGSHELHPQEACSTASTFTSGNQSVDLPSSTSTGEHEGERLVQMQEANGVDVLDKHKDPGTQIPDEPLVARTSAAKPIITSAMIRREGQRPQTHNLFNEKLALFTEDDARMLNDNISVKSLTPDSSDSSDLDDSDSDDDRDFATKTEKYRHPEFIRENPELAPHAEILASPQILADFKTIKERYPGRSGIFTTDEPVYLVSAEDDDVNELSLLERFALSDPRSDVHHQARDGLMNVLYDLVGFHEPSDEALGALALIRKAYADSGPDEELEEADPKADEPKSNVAALSFSTAVSVMRFLCQSKTDIFPGIISDLLAQPPSGPQKKPDPPHCTSTPPSEALPDGSNAVRARDIGAVQADLREKLAPLEADLRTELMWPTLKTVVELLPLFDLSEWTPDQIAALLFALARIYIDRMAGADLQYAAEKAFELILAKYELGELLMDNGVLTKFLKLFPLIDEALGGLNSLIRTIFRHIPLLKSQRVKALAELVAYLLKQLPPMSDEDRSLIETEREKTSDWKLPQDYFNIYSSLPHIYKQLVEVPNQLYHFVEILCEAIVGTKRALTAFDSGGLDYMWNQQTIAENCLNKTFDHRIIKDSSDRALESVNHVRGIKHRALGWLANGKDDDSDTDSDSD